MKYKFLAVLVSILSFTGYSQVTGAAPTGEAGLFNSAQGGNPMLNLVMMNLRVNEKTKGGEEILGSPYLTENFIKSKVYFGEEYVGDFFVRYNALNSEIEIKETDLQEENPKRLLANQDLRVKYGNRELRFTTYITKKNETKNGYLSIISAGDSYTLYHRLAVKYSEGKAAANSMVMAIPSRYAHFVEYYYKKTGVDRIDQLTQKKGALLKILDKEIRDQVNSFIKEEKIDLSEETDLIRTFEYINSIDTSS
ncbi:MAG: hypothetical protein HKO75_11310 [Flavobacteriaceae bacterium]|nr:hypothetical protein [Muriicola sp.]NNC61002.1 hypothetical protein [Eudoraea sp.]NNK12082.1 hypothetical protein [Flavobacteriaceae bacterium]MBT8290114.1 hypothetical protein [Muriicola sp.]NNK35308.1 hypothetical protein [Eudoraea sp.]